MTLFSLRIEVCHRYKFFNTTNFIHITMHGESSLSLHQEEVEIRSKWRINPPNARTRYILEVEQYSDSKARSCCYVAVYICLVLEARNGNTRVIARHETNT